MPLEPTQVLLALLAVLTVGYGTFWARHLVRARRQPISEDASGPAWALGVIGAVTNFFDTLGIGSFAPTTAIWKFLRFVPDRVIPGTLNVGHTVPTIAQAFIFVAAIEVGPWTLISMIAAAVAGAWLGAGIVASWPKRNVQIGMGIALLVAAGFLLKTLLDVNVAGSTATSLEGALLALGLGGNFVLGALMTLGIGLYAPCMVLVALLGMNVKAAFPIMMGSCAFLMPIASAKFISKGCYAPRAALGLAIGGLPAVLVAGLIVKEMPLTTVRWVVLGVVLYTAGLMLWSARRTSRAPEAAPVLKVAPSPAETPR
ncbi:MAG TPA: sulfite exporter TauE/SafE family protein [Planctomycetota bacterium]|nr:sulfite exporter TauE/SafE family protein [Planctomycetota bacterium]